jgi:hypothetical protein
MIRVMGSALVSACWKSSSNDSVRALSALASPNCSIRYSGVRRLRDLERDQRRVAVG